MKAAFIRAARKVRRSRLWSLFHPVYAAPVLQAVVGKRIKRAFGIEGITGSTPFIPSDRGPAPVRDESELRHRYENSAVSKEPDTFVLYRIIGNDIVPRHRRGQSRENLRFVLEHEPKLAGCEKRWVVNRIADKEEEHAVRELLEEDGRPYIYIPFEENEYARCGWDLGGLPRPGYTLSAEFRELPDDFRGRLWKRVYRHKNNYLINNNGARNAALADGKLRAKWVLPWDGNCFLTETAWAEIVDAVRTRPWYPYGIVPMARITEHDRLLKPGFRPDARDEPQILFRRDTKEAFSEEFFYGRRPKVELLWRLGVPGPWDEWAMEPWDLPCPEYGPDAGAWRSAGWVARLPSGSPALDRGRRSEIQRLGVRTEAVTAFLRTLDGGVLSKRISSRKPLLYVWGGDGNAWRAEFSAKAQNRLPSELTRFIRACCSGRQAEKVLLSCRHVPFLLDGSEAGQFQGELEVILRWLRHDDGALEAGRNTGPAGAWWDLFTAVCEARLKQFERLSEAFLVCSDRASLLFADSDGANILEDETCRLAWQALDACAQRLDIDLWAVSPRPESLYLPIQKDPPPCWNERRYREEI